jgi:hypothetical protein
MYLLQYVLLITFRKPTTWLKHVLVWRWYERGHTLTLSVDLSPVRGQYFILSVICVVFLWSVSIDKAYLNALVVVSKLLGQSILGTRQLPSMNILVLKKRMVASSKSIIREKVNVVVSKPKWKPRNNYFVKIEHP